MYSTHSPCRNCYYSLPTHKHQKAKFFTHSIQQNHNLPPPTNISLCNWQSTFINSGSLPIFPWQHHKVDIIIVHIGNVEMEAGAGGILAEAEMRMDIEETHIGSFELQCLDLPFTCCWARSLGDYTLTQFLQAFWVYRGSVARLWTPGYTIIRPVSCLFPSATIVQLRQLLPVCITGHRDHSAQLLENLL